MRSAVTVRLGVGVWSWLAFAPLLPAWPGRGDVAVTAFQVEGERPRIRPLSLKTSRLLISEWAMRDDCVLSKDLLRSQQFYDVQNIESTSPSLGCIGVVLPGRESEADDDVRAIALLEKVNGSGVVLWDVSCCDASTGSLLVKSLVHVLDANMTVSYALHARWRIAAKYHLRDRLVC